MKTLIFHFALYGRCLTGRFTPPNPPSRNRMAIRAWERGNNYFNGGVIYEIPSGEDRFELDVSPPFGEENITVYASPSQVGEIDLKPSGGVYEIKTKA
ncbi:MAG: DUF4384 domain-containing protein, partial [Deltaproteobacteria bacterium]|nr:DUF4384 domain-containing protein [Deltaproteobacteria bacterium]